MKTKLCFIAMSAIVIAALPAQADDANRYRYQTFAFNEYTNPLNNAVATDPVDTNLRVELDTASRNGAAVVTGAAAESKADMDTTAAIRKEISAGNGLSMTARSAKVDTRDGKVSLHGPVDTIDDKRLIGDIAIRLVGAANVKNNLDVRGEAGSK